ncbi:MAG: cyclic pyranopterin monophosphate synthase MoaC [Bacteroidetes bacterium]|nr:cyclic pyranopterin monophosphate synthase MoaC [Rhodothermia bacterium]MCS7155126.1 cyclic pyranopterin monophosphate synthase MoaC [Bacteroidota bacterium]MCX7906237.1 cyclic pyranopterin monophosphate synthase MoaC [Bacteroidota bacterium]MDW8138765.1 cyclic pyranopterin monophosphate synthase MoaC [Bacteroidota bacterium]MDW8286418.1 cyclic pyranopterin monophosphate synthase MoaC [Bacteroidota bacterium]
MTESPSYFEPHAQVAMIDVGEKPPSKRTAVAQARVRLGPEAYEALTSGRLRKGDALSAAQIAGIQAAKRTHELIPLCHPVLLTHVELELQLQPQEQAVEIRAYAQAYGPTGVEMEALTAAAVAALTLYDMCKGISRDIEIEAVRLLAKTGGQSGDYRREAP